MGLTDRLDDEHLALVGFLPPDLLDLRDIPAARQRLAALGAMAPPPPLPADVAVQDHEAPGPAGAPPVMVRTYRPAGLRPGAPALCWIHGGGMVLGQVAMSDAYCAELAVRLDVLVASVEYRLAPEHPFPAPLEDCYAGLVWLHASAAELGLDASRIAVGGASAGGGLAAGVALAARDRGGPPLVFQFLVYPMLDDRAHTHSSRSVDDTRVWNTAANGYAWHAYLDGRAGTDDVSVYAAPARATDLSGLPPAYINVGDLDLFLDEDVAYAQALGRAGVPAELHIYPGAFHGSNVFAATSALSQRWLADELAALGRALG